MLALTNVFILQAYSSHQACELHVSSWMQHLWHDSGRSVSCSPLAYVPQAWAANRSLQVGVNLGGWLVMEPTMFDQPVLSTSNAELDIVKTLRATLGDATALKTMRNHWVGFVDTNMVNELAAAGVTHVRIPLGYW